VSSVIFFFGAPAKAGAQEPRATSLGTLGSCFRRSTKDVSNGDAGFSLIEALVALAILAIASVGLVRTVETHIDSTRTVERRATAMWVAENRLAELQIGDPAAAIPQVEMLGQRWQVHVDRATTDDPELVRVRIRVAGVGSETPLATLDGFVDGRPAA